MVVGTVVLSVSGAVVSDEFVSASDVSELTVVVVVSGGADVTVSETVSGIVAMGAAAVLSDVVSITVSLSEKFAKRAVSLGEARAREVITPSPSNTALIPSAVYTQPPSFPEVSSAPFSKAADILSIAVKSA